MFSDVITPFCGQMVWFGILRQTSKIIKIQNARHPQTTFGPRGVVKGTDFRFTKDFNGQLLEATLEGLPEGSTAKVALLFLQES